MVIFCDKTDLCFSVLDKVLKHESLQLFKALKTPTYLRRWMSINMIHAKEFLINVARHPSCAVLSLWISLT